MSATPSPLARSAHRAGSAALIAVVTGGVVSLLFANPEPAALASDPPTPTVTVSITTTTPAATHPAAPAAASAATAPATTTTGAAKQAPADPRTVAAGWYAARHHLPAGKVRVLQADQLTRNRVQVLLMVERATGRLDSAIVTVSRSSNGSWKVRS